MLVVDKLKHRMRREQKRATHTIRQVYEPLIDAAKKRCCHRYSSEYLKRDHIGPTGTYCNIFHTPFVFKRCELCGHEESRLLEDDESTKNLHYEGSTPAGEV